MAAPSPVPLGTYIGIGKNSKGHEVSYTLRLMEKKFFWLDFKEVKAHDKDSWHSEGVFKIDTSGAAPVVKAEIGGMPGQARVGDVYEFQAEGGDACGPPKLLRDGVSLMPQADTMVHAEAAHVCAQCGLKIEGQAMKYGGEEFHKECFVCSKCKNPLAGSFSKQADGTRICQACIPQKTCETCGEAITGKMTGAGGKFFHPDCFVCGECKSTLSGGFFNKNGVNLCKVCLDASSKGTLKIRRTCRGCKKPIEADGEVKNGEKNEVFHPECFKCAECSATLDGGYKVVDSRYCCNSCAGKVTAKASVAPCCLCQAVCDAGNDYVRLADGSTLHWSCFKCAGCGKAESSKGSLAGSPKLLRTKANLAKDGKFKCDACEGAQPAAPDPKANLMPLGTYTGKGPHPKGPGPKGTDNVAFAVRLMEQNGCWFDCTTTDMISTGAWHAEGKYTEEKEGDKVKTVTFTVKATPHGGGPEVGTVYVFGVEIGKVLIVEKTVKCPLQSEVPDLEVAEYMNAAEKLVGPAGKVAKATPVNPSAVLPGEGQDTKMLRAAHGIMARTEVKDEHKIDRTQKSAAPAAAASTPAPAGCFTLAELQDASVWKDKGVDAGKREEYLSDAEFETHFGKNKADWAKDPKWKRDKQKRELNIF